MSTLIDKENEEIGEVYSEPTSEEYARLVLAEEYGWHERRIERAHQELHAQGMLHYLAGTADPLLFFYTGEPHALAVKSENAARVIKIEYPNDGHEERAMANIETWSGELNEVYGNGLTRTAAKRMFVTLYGLSKEEFDELNRSVDLMGFYSRVEGSEGAGLWTFSGIAEGSNNNPQSSHLAPGTAKAGKIQRTEPAIAEALQMIAATPPEQILSRANLVKYMNVSRQDLDGDAINNAVSELTRNEKYAGKLKVLRDEGSRMIFQRGDGTIEGQAGRQKKKPGATKKKVPQLYRYADSPEGMARPKHERDECNTTTAEVARYVNAEMSLPMSSAELLHSCLVRFNTETSPSIGSFRWCIKHLLNTGEAKGLVRIVEAEDGARLIAPLETIRGNEERKESPYYPRVHKV